MSDMRFLWCSTCRNNFPMRDSEYKKLEESGDTFFCHKGHPMAMTQKYVVDKLRSAERSVDYNREQIERLRKREECLRGVRSREKNRLLRGDCPYCGKRTGQMVLHIQNKHGPKVSRC